MNKLRHIDSEEKYHVAAEKIWSDLQEILLLMRGDVQMKIIICYPFSRRKGSQENICVFPFEQKTAKIHQ